MDFTEKICNGESNLPLEYIFRGVQIFLVELKHAEQRIRHLSVVLLSLNVFLLGEGDATFIAPSSFFFVVLKRLTNLWVFSV